MASTAAVSRYLRFGDFELDLRSGELRNNGHTTRLPEQLFRLLVLLLERRGDVVTREELRQSLWTADTFVDFDMALNTAIKKLRDALGDSADHPRFIETLPRRGYRLVIPIEENASHATSIARSKRMWTALLAAAIIIGVLATVISRQAFERTDKIVPARIESIAVLPLENLSRDPGEEYFADGMTDALITDLAQIRDLRVISRTSVMQYKKARKSLPDIARELNVDAVVEGTVTRSGSRVRVTAQLIHAASDQHLWAKTYERDLVDILPLQGELAQAIAGAVQVNIAPQVRSRLRNSRQVDPEAYQAFFRGMVAASQQSSEGYLNAIKYFEKAIEIQPDFALAYSWMAKCHYQFAFLGPLPPAEFMPRVEASARNALNFDASVADAHTSLANTLYRYHWKWAEAESEFRRAIELSPNDVFSHRQYALFLSGQGRHDEAFRETEIGRTLDPNGANLNVAEIFRAARQYDRAIAEYRKAVELNGAPREYFQLGSTLVMNGEFSEGIKALEAAHPEKNPRFLAYLGYAYGAAGNDRRARQILEELIARSDEQYVSSFGIAMVHLGLGERQAALQRLEQAYQEHAYELAHLNVIPVFDPLRAEPRFQDLVKRLGLPAPTDAGAAS